MNSDTQRPGANTTRRHPNPARESVSNGSSCSQGFQEIFSALPLHCSFVSTELPSRLATLRLRLPCIILWVCTEQLSRLPRHLLCSICNALYVCTELLSRLSRHLLCSTSNALLLSTELLSRLSRSLLSSACIALCVGTELLSRLPRHHPCSISNALLVSTELLSRFSRYLSIQLHRSFVRTEQLSSLPRFLLCYLCNDPLSCSQGLQETFSALCIVILQASIPTMICPSLHFKEGLSKAFFIVQSSFIRASQGKASASAPLHRLINQTQYQNPTDMHSPSPSITTRT